MIKVNDVYIEKISEELYLVKEYNTKKQMFYTSSYTEDEIKMYFLDIKKEIN